jgi:hypothetical protein
MDRIYLTVDTDLTVDEVMEHLTARQIVDHYWLAGKIDELLLQLDAAELIAHLVRRAEHEG